MNAGPNRSQDLIRPEPIACGKRHSKSLSDPVVGKSWITSAAELLDTFGLAKGGKEYRRLVSAFERIFGTTIFFGTDSSRSASKVVHRVRFNFLSEAQIWHDRDPAQIPLSEEFANVVVLSDEFYREIVAHPISADLEAIKVLAASPAVLDPFWSSSLAA